MDDTPTAFLEEIRRSILRKRVGQIALAVVIAQAIWRLISALTWYLFIPTVARMLEGNTESVLFKSYSHVPFPWENLGGSIVEFAFTVIVIFYLNRWIHQKAPAKGPEIEEYTLVGEATSPAQANADFTC
jgi:large-conductance mechanosensitive channel